MSFAEARHANALMVKVREKRTATAQRAGRAMTRVLDTLRAPGMMRAHCWRSTGRPGHRAMPCDSQNAFADSSSAEPEMLLQKEFLGEFQDNILITSLRARRHFDKRGRDGFHTRSFREHAH